MQVRALSRAVLALVLVCLAGGPAVGASTAPRTDATSDPVSDAKGRKLALGVSMPDGRDLADLDDFRASIGGHRVASWTIWSQWGRADTREFPMAAARAARARGAVPVIWWEPIDPSDWADTTYTRHRNIIHGHHDAYIRRFARDARRFGGRILLRFAHQANSDYLPWAWDYSRTDDNTQRTFKGAWHHVRRIFRRVGATNVKFVWSIATQTCAGSCLRRSLGYPGDRWVDYLGFTWENWGTADPGSLVPSQPTVPMLRGFRPVVRRLGSVSRKPILAVAVASSPDGGKRARWIRAGYPAVLRDLPRIKAIMWLNVDLSGAPTYHRDWSLSGPSLEAYADIAARPRFQGRLR